MEKMKMQEGWIDFFEVCLADMQSEKEYTIFATPCSAPSRVVP
jgi:hypothetical protein